jgi:hypothetical protein
LESEPQVSDPKNAHELILTATPMAQRIVEMGMRETDNLIVWLLALQMAVKIEIEIYTAKHPERATQLGEDLELVANVVNNMSVVRGSEPTGQFNVKSVFLGSDKPS